MQGAREHYNHDRGHISGQMDGRPDLDWTLTDEESRDGIGTKYFNIMWAEENSLYKLKAGIL